MIRKVNKMKNKVKSMFVLYIIILSMFTTIPALLHTTAETKAPPENLSIDELNKLLNGGDYLGMNSNGDSLYPEDIDLAQFLKDNPNEYYQIYQPWKTKAAVRCIEITDDFEYMIVGGGYLYDNEVHVYRWNPHINQYVKVWNSGDEIIKEDVIDVDIADTDHNTFLEIVAASSDGSFHVFEQQHIYDPNTNTENMFAHVYSSPYIGQVWAVEINDTDWDHDPDIIVASWDYKIHIYEYDTHSGYPFSAEHWIEYEEKWTSPNLRQHPTSLVVGDTNYNGLPDFVVGTREGGIFVFENNGTVLDINGQPYPLCQDNSYKLIYNDTSSIWRAIYSMEIANLDNQPGDEVVIAAFAFNAYVLRYNLITETYYLQKLIKDFEPWTLKDYYPADDWIDSLVASQNLYFIDPVYTGHSLPEPTDPTTFAGANFPYNTGTAQNNITCTTLFDSNATYSAYGIFDFGNDEEGTGNGNNKADFSIVFKQLAHQIDLNDFIISISPDNDHWMVVNITDISIGSSIEGFATIDINVDDLLFNNKWDYFRYVNLTILPGSIDYNTYRMELHYVNIKVDTALCATVGTLVSSGVTSSEELNALIGTVDGRIVAFTYNESLDEFILAWDSWVDDRFSLGTNIWDLEQVKTIGSMPMLLGFTHPETNEYLWKPDPQPYMQIGHEIFDYDFGNIITVADGDPYGVGEYIISDLNGDVYFFTSGFSYDAAKTTDYFFNINNHAPYNGKNLSVSLFDISDFWNGPEVIIGWYDPTISNVYDDFYDDTYTSLPADLEFWLKPAGTTYDLPTPLSALEITGQLSEILKSAQSVPSADAVDIDDDGDLDVVVCIDNLYLLWNIGDSSIPTFVLDSDYFADINEVQGKRKFFSPQFVEFDNDGNYDLVIGYSNRVGATYFDNYGTFDDPKWEEKKELLNNFDEEATINVFNLTRPLFISYLEFNAFSTIALGEEYFNKYLMYVMFDVYKNDVHLFSIQYDVQTSYLVATYPLISRLEINSFKSELGIHSTFGLTNYRNFGFRAIESWSTLSELYNWTLTVDTSDIDQDGNGEIIVGDFDNNIYIFEHMTNNTYKRAFRSLDMYQNYPTDESPYAYDQLGSFTGEFNQTIWNHVSHILVGVDINKNGYLELIALAGTVIYIFETVYDEYSGRIIDDTYTLVHHYDLLLSQEADYLKENGYLEPTGLTWANDLDLDGYSEIIVAFGSQVLIYVPYLGKLYEIFGNIPPDTTSGHYNLPGNSKVYNNITITGIKVTDSNRNGLEEIIIYGDIGLIGWDLMGYLVVIENCFHGYQIIWQLPDDAVRNNRILTLEVSDQDYDGKLEFLIGGEKGISIWEFNGTTITTTYQQISVVTGHMNYPLMDAYPILGESNYHTLDEEVRQRSHDVIQFMYGSNNSYLMVYSEKFDTGIPAYGIIYALYQMVSHDGINWHSKQIILVTLYDHLFPTLTQIENGDIYLGFVGQTATGAGGDTYAFVCLRSSNYGSSWITEGALDQVTILGSIPYRSPTIFAYEDLGIGYSFVNKTGTSSVPYYGWKFSNGTHVIAKPIVNLDDFYVNGIDVIAHPENSWPDHKYAVAMSAHKTTENKDDYDIWFFEVNSSFIMSIEPRKLVESSAVEHTPSIAYQNKAPYSLLLTYDAAGYKQAMSTSYGLVSSDYLEWSEPDIIAVYPDYIGRNTTTGVPYFKNQPGWNLYNLGFRAPKISSTYDGRFVIVTKLDIYGSTISGVANWEDFLSQTYNLNITFFTALNRATDLAVGDSDKDGFNEILVADGNIARLLELFTSQKNYHGYDAKWKSSVFNHHVSDVSIFDTNGNGFPELIFSVQGDDIYVFEITNLNLPITNLIAAEFEFEAYDPTPITLSNALESDLNEDGIPDYIVALTNNTLFGVLGDTGEVIWIQTSTDPVYMLLEGTYRGNSAIFFATQTGSAKWFNKTTGIEFTTFQLERQTDINPRGILYNLLDTNTDEILVTNTTNCLTVLNGTNGNIISEKTIGSTISRISVAYNSISKTIVAGLQNRTVIGYNSSLSVQWTVDVGDSGIVWSLTTNDINNDGETEIFTMGAWNALIAYDGTLLWNVSAPQWTSYAVFADINNDGIKDIITQRGAVKSITAYNSIDGSILWTLSDTFTTSFLSTGDLNEDGKEDLIFTFSSPQNGIAGCSIHGGMIFYYPIDTYGWLYYPVVTKVNSKTGFLVSTSDATVLGISISEILIDMEYENPLTGITLENIYSANPGINENTVVIDDFLGSGKPYLFFVEDDNTAVFFDLENRLVINSTILDIEGSITHVYPADFDNDGYPTGVYLTTDALILGSIRISGSDLIYTQIADFSTTSESISGMIAHPDSTGQAIAIVILRTSGENYEIRYLDKNGNKALNTETFSANRPPHAILAGHLLPVVGINGEFLVVGTINRLQFFSLADGLYYDEVDGTIGLVELSYRFNPDTHMKVYYQDYDQIVCFDLNELIQKQWTHDVGIAKIYDFAFADYNEDNRIDVYAIQNGTSTFLLSDTAAATTEEWARYHHSFEAKYLKIIKDTSNKTRLLIGDYHRLFLATTGSGNVFTGTTNQFEQIKYLEVWPNYILSNETSIIFLAGDIFYSHNLSIAFGFGTTIEEDKTPVELSRLIKLWLTGAIIATIPLVTIVVISRKVKIPKIF